MSMRPRLRGLLACAAALWCLANHALAADARGRVVTVVTSFPASLYEPIREAFEAAHPGYRLRVLQRKTSAAITHVRTRLDEPVDVFWASAPDPFEILKEEGLLARIGPRPGPPLPAVGGVPIDDVDGTYLGFALSGYGLLWSDAYLARHGLPVPQSFDELRDARFHRHVGMSAPSRSGTTHLMVESTLQRYGWDLGWAMWLEIAGNLATVTARSFGVADGVANGRFGIGLAIDFFSALPGKAGSVTFTYPREGIFLPASVAVLARATEADGARSFVAFLLSVEGQRLLMRPNIRRLPVLPELYDGAPDMPDPFGNAARLADGGLPPVFDRRLSAMRYELVNLLFDEMITFRSGHLERLWRSVRDCERQLAARPDAAAADILAEARRTLTAVPVSAEEARDPAFVAGLRRLPRGVAVAARQSALEQAWRVFARAGSAHTARLVGRACPGLGAPLPGAVQP